MGMDFKGAKQRARELLAPARPRDLSESVLTDDKLRNNIIRDAERVTPRFKAACDNEPVVRYDVTDEDGNTEQRDYTWSTFGEMVRDTARALFDLDGPQLRPREQVRPENQLNYDIAQFLFNEEAFRQSVPYARMNEAQAMFGAAALADEMTEQASNVLAEHIKRSEDMAGASEAAQSAAEMFDQLRQKARQEIEDHGTVQRPTRQQIKRNLRQQAAAQQALGQLMQQANQSGQVIAAAQAAQAAAQAAKEAIDALGQLPGTQDGSAKQLPPDKQLELADRWRKNPAMLRMLKLVGRMYRDWRFKRDTRTKNVAIEPVGITTGQNLERMVPHELAKAFMPELRALFIKDWVEGKVLEYEYEGREPAGKGPLIFGQDDSGSMSGDRWIWASSVSICCALTAAREKRTFAWAHVGASEREYRQWLVRKGEALDPDVLYDNASHFYGGGTSIRVFLRHAVQIVREEPGFKTADVVIISDGEDRVTDEDLRLVAELRELNVRIHGVSIMARNNVYMQTLCDYVVDITDLAIAGDAGDEAVEALSTSIT